MKKKFSSIVQQTKQDKKYGADKEKPRSDASFERIISIFFLWATLVNEESH